jgi:uncharacterized membrane protein YbhN (UPF0104 family)
MPALPSDDTTKGAAAEASAQRRLLLCREDLVQKRALFRTLFVVAALVLGFGFLVRVVPWADRCKDGGSIAQCTRSNLEPGLRTVLATMDARLLALGAALYALGAPLWALRWRIVLSVTPSAPRYRELLRATVESYAAMALLVGGIGGDALRLGTLVSSGLAPAWAAASLAVDRAVGLAALLLMGLALAAPDLIAWNPLAVLILPTMLVLLAGGLLAALLAPIPRVCPHVLRRVLEAVRGPYGSIDFRAGLAALSRALGTSLVVASTQLGAFGCFVAASHAQPASLGKLVAGIVETFVVGAIPSVPGGWGTGEAAAVFFLRPAGIQEAEALAASVAFRLAVLPIAAIGVVSLASRARERR